MTTSWKDERDPLAEGFLKRVLFGWLGVVAVLFVLRYVDLPLWAGPTAIGLGVFVLVVGLAWSDEKRTLR